MIIVPRPAPHLPRTVTALQAAGFKHLLPLALSQPTPIPFTLPANTQALLLTSPFSLQPGLPNLPAYCVGETTATAARQYGLQVVYNGTNNAISMAQAITQHATRNTQHFLHLHGDHAHLHWHTILQLAGHTVTAVPTYQTRRITALPPEIIQALTQPKTTPVTLLFSAGSASHLANLLKHANIPASGQAICFSPAVAQAAAAFWLSVITAPETSLTSMIHTLQTLNTEH